MFVQGLFHLKGYQRDIIVLRGACGPLFSRLPHLCTYVFGGTVSKVQKVLLDAAIIKEVAGGFRRSGSPSLVAMASCRMRQINPVHIDAVILELLGEQRSLPLPLCRGVACRPPYRCRET